jgi:Na+/proline symporter
MVSSAYQVTLVGAFVPLTFGLYWRAATTQGALSSVACGLSTWLVVKLMPGWGDAFPSQLAGLLASIAGMLAGSMLPQFITNTKASEEATYSVHPEGVM